MRWTDSALISAGVRNAKSTLPMADAVGWEIFILRIYAHQHRLNMNGIGDPKLLAVAGGGGGMKRSNSL